MSLRRNLLCIGLVVIAALAAGCGSDPSVLVASAQDLVPAAEGQEPSAVDPLPADLSRKLLDNAGVLVEGPEINISEEDVQAALKELARHYDLKDMGVASTDVFAATLVHEVILDEGDDDGYDPEFERTRVERTPVIVIHGTGLENMSTNGPVTADGTPALEEPIFLTEMFVFIDQTSFSFLFTEFVG